MHLGLNRILACAVWVALSLESLGQETPPPRLPEPAAEAQRESEKLIREVFKEEYARKSAADQKALARKLLRQGIETRDDPTARYVLFGEAREIAEKVGDLETAMAAIAEAAKYYEIDGTALKANALAGMAAGAKSPEAAAALTDVCLEVIDEAVREEKFEVARGLVPKAEGLEKGAKDIKKIVQVQRKGKEIEEFSKESEKAKEAAKTLESNPADPEASLALGRHLLMKGEVEKALALLVKGSDEALKRAAEAEMAAPLDLAKAAEAGDAWWEAAEKEKKAALKVAIQGRARSCYENALPVLKGFSKAKIEKRLRELMGTGAPKKPDVGWLKLIPLIVPSKDSVAGKWEIQNGELYSDETAFARIAVPYRPPEEYDYRVTFTRTKGSESVNLILSKSGKSFSLILGAWGSSTSGFVTIDGKDLTNNPTSTKVGLQNGKRHVATVQVRNDGLKAFLDDSLIISWKTDYSDISNLNFISLRDPNLLGVYSFQSPTIFHDIEVREVSGRGRRTR